METRNSIQKYLTNILSFIRNYLAWPLFISGILLASVCYYVLFFTTTPVERMAPPSSNLAPGKKDFKVTVFGDWMLVSGVVEKIGKESIKQKSDFAVCLGDFVHPANNPVIRIAVENMKKNFSAPVYATPGNHDISDTSDRAGFSAVFGDVNNYFAHGDTLFIMLDSSQVALEKNQLKYLKSVLDNERSKYRRCVIFTHVPPVVIPAFNQARFRLNEETAAELQDIVEKGKVDLIVCGHAHCEMDIPWGKTRVLVIPPSGQYSRDVTNPQFGSLFLHFQENGSIEPEFIYYGDKVSGDYFQYVIYHRLNQRSIVFCIALAMIICSIILLKTGLKKGNGSRDD